MYLTKNVPFPENRKSSLNFSKHCALNFFFENP